MTETRTLKNFVNGEYVDSANGQLDLVNPSTGEVFAASPVTGEGGVDAAFKSAERAFETWRDSTPAERRMALLRIADKLEERAEDFVKAESENTGKPLGPTMEEEISMGAFHREGRREFA